MRFLTTCLLLFCFQSFVVCTVEDGSVTFVQEHNISKSAALTKLVAKNLTTETILATSFDFVDVIQHNINKHISAIKLPAFLFIEKRTTLQTIKHYGQFLNHSYSFIFRCLYPKHTFW